MIYDFFKISGDNEAILDFRDLSKVQFKNDNVQAFDTEWDKELSAVTDRLADNKLEGRLHPLDHKMPMFFFVKHVCSSMTKGRPRSPSPTGSPHPNSKGDGKGSDNESAEGTPKFTGESPTESEQTTLYKLQERKSLPSETSSSRVQVCSQDGNIGTYTWSHPHQILKPAKAKRSNIRGKTCRMDSDHGRKSKESSLGFTPVRQHSRFDF